MPKIIVALVLIGLSGCTGFGVDLSATTASTATQDMCATASLTANQLQNSLDAAMQAQTDGTSRSQYFEQVISASPGDIPLRDLNCFIAVLDQVYGAE